MMNTYLYLPCLILAGVWASSASLAQTYVTPMMGGGQAAADMVHIYVNYDMDANQMHALVDDSYGTPELRPLGPGYAFDPQQPYNVLNGRAYNAQYGWVVGGLFAPPPGAAIWIELLDCSPGLEAYSGWGPLGSYAPLFGTAGSPGIWKWSGVMIHNTYAVLHPAQDRFFAEYRIYFGDAATGARANFADFGDTTVRLEWITTPSADPVSFDFGADGLTNGAPLCFVNAQRFVTNSQTVVSFQYTNVGARAFQYVRSIPMLVLPATAQNGGPVGGHAALGSRLELQLVSLSGPSRGTLQFWELSQSQPQLSLLAGSNGGTNCLALSQGEGAPGSDPYGCIQGRTFALSQPGLYCLGFRLVDSSTNGPGGGPIHAPSPLYHVYLQAGLTIHSLTCQGSFATALFGGQDGKTFSLERSAALGPAASWQNVAGPLPGTNSLQTLTDETATGPPGFYRLRAW